MSCSPDQYLNLYDANRALLGDRDDARRRLEGAVLPDVFAPDYGLNLTRMALPVNVAESFRCDVPTVTTALGLVLNDAFVPSSTLASRLPEGVSFCSLNSPEGRELLCRAMPSETPEALLGDLLGQDGVLVHVGRNVSLNKPLQLVNIFSAPIDLMAVRRLLVVMEEGSDARMLVCDHTQDSIHNYLALERIDIVMERNARFHLVDIEESSPLTARRLELNARLKDDATLSVTMAHLSGGDTASSILVHLDGQGADARINGMSIAGGQSRVAHSTSVNHHGEHTKSDQLFKYVADDHARCSFTGRIKVDEQARFTEAYQTNRNILASDTARMHSEPALEIYCDEVKCSHGAATGQLDANALFYMRSRGIPEAQARHMLMEAFMADVIDRVGIDGLPDRLRLLVERRFNGVDSAACSNCQPCNPVS